MVRQPVIKQHGLRSWACPVMSLFLRLQPGWVAPSR